MAAKIRPFRMTKAVERRRHRERYKRLPCASLTIVAGREELGPQADGPIDWTEEAYRAFRIEYGNFRRYPGTPLYPHHVIAKCLTAVWRAQGLNLIQFTSAETDNWARAHYQGCQTTPNAFPGCWEERDKAINKNAFDAALTAYHAHRVVPLVTREKVRSRRRAEHVEAVRAREDAMVAQLRARAEARGYNRYNGGAPHVPITSRFYNWRSGDRRVRRIAAETAPGTGGRWSENRRRAETRLFSTWHFGQRRSDHLRRI